MEENNIRTVDRRRFKYIAFLVLVITVVTVIILLQAKDSFFTSPQTPRGTPGLPAPNITLPGLDGKMVGLRDYKGRVVFLNIRATWCPTCREEMPSMERLYQELKGKDFEILAVSIDTSGVNGVPESFIINREGIVEKVVIGPIGKGGTAPDFHMM